MVSSLGFCLELKTLAVLPKPTMCTSGGSDPLSPPMLGIQGISSSSPCSPPVQSSNHFPNVLQCFPSEPFVLAALSRIGPVIQALKACQAPVHSDSATGQVYQTLSAVSCFIG